MPPPPMSEIQCLQRNLCVHHAAGGRTERALSRWVFRHVACGGGSDASAGPTARGDRPPPTDKERAEDSQSVVKRHT